ncbi:hypothetical protein EON81_20340, partial [bacterium]
MMRATAKAFAIAAFAWVTQASAQQPLPNLRVDVDGNDVILGPVYLEIDTYLVPLRDTLRNLPGGPSLSLEAGKYVEITVDGKPRARIPLSAGVGKVAEVFGAGGVSDVVAKIPIAIYPSEINSATYVDIDLLGAIFGMTVDFQGRRLSLLTSGYWSKQIGLKAPDEGQSLGILPDFGVSPPAKT